MKSLRPPNAEECASSINCDLCYFVGYCVMPLQTIIFVSEFAKTKSNINFISSQAIWLIFKVFEILIDRKFYF